MGEIQTQSVAVTANNKLPRLLSPSSSSTTATTPATATSSAPVSAAANLSQSPTSRLRGHLVIDSHVAPVNQNGSFEFDRVIKSGYVQKRTQKTKTWRTIFLVLRPTSLSIYKNDKESKLRQKIFLSELTAVAYLKDRKQKRQNVFGLFTQARNYHFQAQSAQDTHEWVESIRGEARIEEEEEEMFLASQANRRHSYGITSCLHPNGPSQERLPSSSPEPQPMPSRRNTSQQYLQQSLPESGWSGNELASSDYSDGDIQQRMRGMSFESGQQSSPIAASPIAAARRISQSQAQPQAQSQTQSQRPTPSTRNVSQNSISFAEADLDRVVWQGWVWFLRSKGGVRQWKDSWAVLRPRNLVLYKDESEYTAQFIIPLPSIVDVVERDPMSRSKTHCMQIITEEKSYRFCAHDEETLLQCLGAFKSLLVKRRDLEARFAAATAAATSTNTIAPETSNSAPRKVSTVANPAANLPKTKATTVTKTVPSLVPMSSSSTPPTTATTTTPLSIPPPAMITT